MDITNAILSKFKEKYKDEYIISDIKCLIDSEYNKENYKLYNENKEQIDTKIQNDKESIICYTTIRNRQVDERIKELSKSKEINLIGCSLFIKNLESNLYIREYEYVNYETDMIETKKISYYDFNYDDDRNIILHLYNSVKNLTNLYELSKQENNNDIINFIKFLDIDKYVIRIYIDHSILYYLLYNNRNRLLFELLIYIFDSPLVEIYYYISPLSGTYIINDDKTCKFNHNDTFGTIMRLMPLFIKDELNYKAYHSRDCRTSFGSIMDLIFMKSYKDEYFKETLKYYPTFIKNFNEDVYANKYVISKEELKDNIIRYSSWVGCKKPIINSHGIKLLLSDDNELKPYLLKYGNERVNNKNITYYSYGVDEVSRAVKPIIIYMIKKIFNNSSNNITSKEKEDFYKIISLSEICLKNLKDNNDECKYYYTNEGIIENKKNEILDEDYNKKLLNNIDIGINNYIRQNQHPINDTFIFDNIIGYIIIDFNEEDNNNYYILYNNLYTNEQNNTDKYLLNIRKSINPNKDYKKNLLFIIRNYMLSKLIKCFDDNSLNNDDSKFKEFLMNMIYMFYIINKKFTHIYQYDYIVYIYLYLNYCSLFDKNTRIALLLTIYQLTTNILHELPLHKEHINNITFNYKYNIYKLEYLNKFDNIMYDIHKDILNGNINNNININILKEYFNNLQQIIYKYSHNKNNNLLSNDFIFNYLISSDFLITLPFYYIHSHMFFPGIFGFNSNEKVIFQTYIDDTIIINHRIEDEIDNNIKMFFNEESN